MTLIRGLELGGRSAEVKDAEGRGVGGKERDKQWNIALERDGEDEGGAAAIQI
jgi:hypothetical protein